MLSLFGRYKRLLRAYRAQKTELEWLREAHKKLAEQGYYELECQVKANIRKRQKIKEFEVYTSRLENTIAEQRKNLRSLRQIADSRERCSKIKCCNEHEAKGWAVIRTRETNEKFISYECK